jgi:hypothetical protein
LSFDNTTPRPARRVSFDIASLPFAQGASPVAKWIPEALTPLSYLPVYAELDEEIRLMYNQRTALALAEKYVFLEDHVLSPAIQTLLRSPHVRIDADARVEMELFCEEEKKHSEAFWRLVEAAAPALYPKREFRYMKTGAATQALLAACEAAPCASTSWIWIALFFEELTIRISKHHAREKSVDALFREVHYAHMVEEAAHVPLDRMLLARVFDTQSALGRKVSFAIFEKFLSHFSSPRHTPFVIFEEVAKAIPRSRKFLPRVRSELLTLRTNAPFQAEFYSAQSAPLTFKLLERYAEAHSFLHRSSPSEGAAS